MIHILATAALFLSTLVAGGCGDTERKLPDGGSGEFVRYASDIGVQSNILKQPVNIAVLLPKDYLSSPDKRYGVVYLLHGYGDSHKAWNDEWLRIENTVAQCEKAGLQDMIYIMPSGFSSYYVNRYDGNFDYMDMFVEELVPYVDNTYRTIADNRHRAVVGYSMGGFGAMILPSKHPEIFSVSVPLSMSFRTDEQYMTESAGGWGSQWGAIFGGKGSVGEARLTDYYKEHCPFYMFTAATKDQYADVAYYLDCGDDEEQLLVANDDLHRQLREIGMPHEYRVRNGAHTGEYWRTAMPEVLRFIECRFNGRDFQPQAAKSYEGHKATKSSRKLAGVAAEIFTPAGYDTTKSYPALYLLHDGRMPLSSDEVMNILAGLQSAKPFVMIACDATADEFAVEGFATAAEEAYSLKTGAAYRTAIAYGDAGRASYGSTLGDSPFCALFLADAQIDAKYAAPNTGLFYFLSLTEAGNNYAAANELYKMCHAGGISFEYRVADGTANDKNSFTSCVEAMTSELGTKINIQ